MRWNRGMLGRFWPWRTPSIWMTMAPLRVMTTSTIEPFSGSSLAGGSAGMGMALVVWRTTTIVAASPRSPSSAGIRCERLTSAGGDAIGDVV